mmetsp:Transcript_40199/g.86186  ORF Transcript_40199/g.86186 Transcript_40199/m.86186 type:complete len:220 (+) Transcript_40199:2-661(+)
MDACKRTNTHKLYSSLVVVAVIGGGLHLVDPVPLSANDLDGHGRGDQLFLGVDAGEDREGQTEDHEHGDVEEEVLGLHQQGSVAPDVQSAPVPVRDVLLGDARPELRVALRGVTRNDEGLSALLDQVQSGSVVDGVGIMVVLDIFSLRSGTIRVQVAPGVSVATEASSTQGGDRGEAGVPGCGRDRAEERGSEQGHHHDWKQLLIYILRLWIPYVVYGL